MCLFHSTKPMSSIIVSWCCRSKKLIPRRQMDTNSSASFVMNSVCGCPLLKDCTSNTDMLCIVNKRLCDKSCYATKRLKEDQCKLYHDDPWSVLPCNQVMCRNRQWASVRICVCECVWEVKVLHQARPPSGLLFTLPHSTQGDDSSLTCMTWYKPCCAATY